MNLFNRKNAKPDHNATAALAEMALKYIRDGVIMVDRSGAIRFINPAAVTMTDCGSADSVLGLDYGLVIKLETKEGRSLSDIENPLVQAIKTNQPLDTLQASLIAMKSDKRLPVSISVLTADSFSGNRIITLRNITEELKEEGEQTEFISTASHEMRTPVATIDGYLTLALNPQTATIDERARGYLTAAEKASKHLGKLFQDLLDVTKLDDGRIQPHFVPVEMVGLIKTISDDYIVRAKDASLTFNFGSSEPISFGANRRMEQVVYGYVDTDFMREIMDNLIENAIKYTPEGGSIYVNVRGDGDRVLINVTDTGIGISAEDLTHIFQKFYRADNSDTRTIGGTGLGLYLVKQRVEAMGGKIWAESAFGEGSTFYVSLPRITGAEYEKRMITIQNREMAEHMASQPTPGRQAAPSTSSTPPIPTPTPTPVPTPAPASQPVVAPSPQPIATPQPVQPTSSVQPAPLTQPAPSVSPAPSTPPTPPAPQPTPPASVHPSVPPTSSPQSPPQPQSAPIYQSPASPPLASQTSQPITPVQNINNNLNGENK